MNRAFSIIIATAGRPERLRASLESIRAAAAERAGPAELIVVDNSPDGRMAGIAQAAASPDLPVRYLSSPPLDKAKALNVGIRQAQHEWLAFTDDDILADPAWLRSADAFIAAGGFRVFGGRVEPDFSGVTRPR